MALIDISLEIEVTLGGREYGPDGSLHSVNLGGKEIGWDMLVEIVGKEHAELIEEDAVDLAIEAAKDMA
jgi:hypothetical protein